MTASCGECGSPGPEPWATVADEAGERNIMLCQPCRDKLATPRCRACGDLVDEETDNALFLFESRQVARLCQDCKNRIVWGATCV